MCRVVFLAVLSVLLGAVYASVTEREPLARAGETVVVVDCVLQGKGSFRVNVVPEWAPLGAERFLDLVRDGFFDGTALFRAVKGFLVQFGIAKESELNQKWSHRIMKDDPKVGVRIRRGTLAFAGSGVNSRATQMFVALSDHSWPHLGKEPWETPFGYIDKSDMERVWGQVNTEYGDMKPWGKRGVDVGKLWAQGYSYLEENFPGMDYITFCKIVQDSSSDEEDPKFVEEDVEDDGSVAQFEKIALRKINDVVSTEKVWAELAWEELPRLRERQELENLYASAGNPCVVAIEEKLPAGTAFEVRVSYLATTPAEFNFEVVDFTALSDAVAEKKDELRRRRLNTERFRIETDSERRVVGVDGDHPVLVIYARRVGVRPSMHEVEQVDNPEVRFNVVLDPLVLMKSVPQSALPMVGWGVVSVAFALLCLAPSLQSRFFLPQRVD